MRDARFPARPSAGLDYGVYTAAGRFYSVNRSSTQNARQNCPGQFCCVPGPCEDRLTARPERLCLSAIEAPLWRPQPMKGASMPNNAITLRSDEGKPVLTIFFVGLNGVIDYTAPMSAPPTTEPTTSELLERITRLEGEVARLAQTNGQILSSHAQSISELTKGLDSETENTTHHIKSLNEEIRHIHGFIERILDQLWPLVHKVFPGSGDTQQQIANIIRNGGRSWDDKSPHR
jgi:hypothetical protein